MIILILKKTKKGNYPFKSVTWKINECNCIKSMNKTPNINYENSTTSWFRLFFFFERYKCYLIMNKLPAKHTINIFLPRYALSKIQLTLVINKKDKL